MCPPRTFQPPKAYMRQPQTWFEPQLAPRDLPSAALGVGSSTRSPMSLPAAWKFSGHPQPHWPQQDEAIKCPKPLALTENLLAGVWSTVNIGLISERSSASKTPVQLPIKARHGG
ncbi:hypothetical protein PMIN06_007802 [Paraphaeosphaeria minitans]